MLMRQDEWEKIIIECMQSKGWKNDRNDETTLGFSFIEGDSHWIRDYDKKSRSYVQFDGNIRVNLKTSQKGHDND